MPDTATASIDPSEVEKFSRIAAEWWDPTGKFGILHKFNPVRLTYIREHVTAHFARDPHQRRPLEGLSVLDIGCGGGLLCEPLTRLGATVTGIDPSEKNIKTASVHAEEQDLAITYRAMTAEALAEEGAKFDIVLNMEVIEHVNDPKAFTATSASLLKPGGLMFMATINRTLKSFGLAILGAEYILRWLPKGTHQWEKFITPEELTAWLKAAALTPHHQTGIAYNPLTGEWKQVRDMAVNYMVVATSYPT
jgi:2-polyprenyl-6-hydroxyphenyl methylase/3-demethylubiquinone-9 3-methyltransferase